MNNPQQAGTKQGLVLMLVPLFAMLGAVLLAPIMGVMFKQFAGQPYAEILVPLLLTAPALMLALLSPFAGVLANRVGGKKVLVFSLALYGVMGAAPMFLDSLYAIFFSRILVGVAEAGLVTAAMVLISQYFSGDERQKWIAYQNVALPLLGALLMGLAGYVSVSDWHNTFAVYGFSFFVFIAAILFLFEPKKQSSNSESAPKEKVKFPPLKTMLVIAGIAIPGSIAFYTVPVKLAFLLQDIGETSPAAVGTMLAFGLILGSPTGAFLSRFIKTWSFGKVLSIAMALMGVGLIMMALATDKTLMTVGLVVQQAGGGLMLTIAITFVLAIAPAAQRGLYSGIWWFLYTISNFITPLFIAGIFYFTQSTQTAVLIVGILCVALFAWLMSAKLLKAPIVAQ
ncbi:MFS transporter [Aliiglaciecola sp. NS0011-25]|uniref:MFS transporter n=1 Tax=Aliiglaciecola sp. NS0011-25 TaxID=3127654 RepID=UPI003109B2E7